MDKQNLTQEMIDDFGTSLDLHIAYVQQAGEMIGVDHDLLTKHDQSKYGAAEFYAYARQFQGRKDDPNGFAGAWLHHIHHNPHHWQHWIFPDKFTPKGSDVIDGVVRMPDRYVLEMIADWMGASQAYTGSWDMTAWLKSNLPKITLHPESSFYLRCVLKDLGYDTYSEEWISESE